MKLTPKQLSEAFSRANAEFRDADKGELSDQEFIAKCWVLALAPLIGYAPPEMPKRQAHEPWDE